MEEFATLGDLNPNFHARKRIEWLLQQARSKEYTRKRRNQFREEAKALTLGHFCQSLGSSDSSTCAYLQCTTDSNNSSVSSATTPYSESDGTKEMLWKVRSFALTHASSKHYDNQMEFSRILYERKQQKKKDNYARKKEQRREEIRSKRDAAAEAKVSSAKKAAEKAEATAEALRQRSQILDIMLQNPVANFPFLLGLVGFLWNAEGSHYRKSNSIHQLFKDDRYPSQEKILEEIGPEAWKSIQRKLFSAADTDLEIFRKQKESEASSSMFASSLFDSYVADDEGEE